ncbi:MAG: ferritin [Armatimonadetes bacterium]|nr:ferritin [Armatimonadota bacterium]
MALSDRMVEKINDQVAAEIYSAYYYLGMALAFDKMGLKVFSQRFFQQYEEEMMHAMKFLKYLMTVGAKAELKEIPRPPQEWDTPEQIVQAAYEHELYVTSRINELVALAEEEKDYATRSFLQWYVDEQVEEESSMLELVELLKLAGPERAFMAEQRVAQMMQSAGSAGSEQPQE